MNSINHREIKQQAHRLIAYVEQQDLSQAPTAEPLILEKSQLAYFSLLKYKFDQNSALACLAVPLVLGEKCDWQALAGLTSPEVVKTLKAYQMLPEIKERLSHPKKLAENIKQLLLAAATDIRVIFVRIGFWYAELRLISRLDEQAARKLADEALQIYAPIAHRLGLYLIKSDMEHRSFKFRYPQEYDQLSALLTAKLVNKHKLEQRLNHAFKDIFQTAQIDFEFTYRIKDIYSIYKKAKEQRLDYQYIYDIIACRILVADTASCYKALGLVHAKFKPLANRFKDYITQPKPNGYQSLHTTVIDDQETVFEVQIRTQQMHQHAEYGLAAHWSYKERQAGKAQQAKQVELIRGLIENFSTKASDLENIAALKRDLYENSIYCFTPLGKIIKLPAGACVIDFAYAIHSEVGNSCAGAKIDGKFSAIRTTLENGQQVEILNSPAVRPNSDWLKYCRTNRAQNLVRNYVKRQSQLESQKLGQRILDKALANARIVPDNFQDNPRIKRYLKKRSLTNLEALWQEIGYGNIEASDVLKALENNLEPAKQPKNIGRILNKPLAFARSKLSLNKMSIGGNLKGIPTRLAACCSPVAGDKLTGVITNSGLVKIHRANCDNLAKSGFDQRQLLTIDWSQASSEQLQVRLLFSFPSDFGHLARITSILDDLNISMQETSIKPIKNGKSCFEVLCQFKDVSLLASIKRKLRNYPISMQQSTR